MHHLHTKIENAAPVDRVWSLLVDFASHSRWNPFVRSVEGILGVGQTLKVFIQPPGGMGMRFRPTVLAVQPNRELRWKGKFLVAGLFDGEHCFKLEANPAGGLTFHHGERFTGILVPFFKRSLDGATRQGFVAMNAALKREAEGPRSRDA